MPGLPYMSLWRNLKGLQKVPPLPLQDSRGGDGDRSEGEVEMEVEIADADPDATTRSRHDNKDTPGGLLTQLFTRLTESPPTLNISAINTEDTSKPQDREVRISHFALPHYVCSGGANSMLNAHRIHHYVRGILHEKASAMQSQKGKRHPLMPLLQHDIALEEAQAIDIVDECFRDMGTGFYSYDC
jgi:hypothetical protein